MNLYSKNLQINENDLTILSLIKTKGMKGKKLNVSLRIHSIPLWPFSAVFVYKIEN